MNPEISKYKEKIIENELRLNWNEYRKLPLEQIRNKMKDRLRKQLQNENEQLSHEEFYNIFMEIVGKNEDKKRRNKKKYKNDKNKYKDEER